MLPWPLLPSVLFLFFLCSFLLKATQAQEVYEDDTSPLMMIRSSWKGPEQAAESREDGDVFHVRQEALRRSTEEDPSSTQVRGDLLQKGIQENSLSSCEEKNEAAFFTEAAAIWLQHYNRADDIAKKKSAYEQELPSLSQESDRAQMLTQLIPLFEQAFLYQHGMNGYLNDCRATFKKTGGPDAVFLESMMKINSRPNKIEWLIGQIKDDYQLLAKRQEQILKARKQIVDFEYVAWPIPNLLTETVQALDTAIVSQRNLIQVRVGSARFIQLPYKKNIDAVTQNQMEANKALITKAQTLAKQQSLLANRRYNQFFRHGALNRGHFDRAHNMIRYMAAEIQREEPRQEIIDCFSRSIEFSQQAAIALHHVTDPSRQERARYFTSASCTLADAAHEIQKEQPRQQVIDCFLRSSEFFEQAVTALDSTSDPRKEERATYLENVGIALSRLAREVQKEQPDEEVIKQEMENVRRWQNKVKDLTSLSCCIIS